MNKAFKIRVFDKLLKKYIPFNPFIPNNKEYVKEIGFDFLSQTVYIGDIIQVGDKKDLVVKFNAANGSFYARNNNEVILFADIFEYKITGNINEK